MTVTASDCVEFLTQVIESEKGKKITFKEKGMAINFRQRCCTTRLREQQKNAKIYAVDHPMHGKTLFDSISLHIREENGQWALLATKDHPDLNVLGRVEDL